MKKAIALMTLVSAIAMSTVPTFAASNGNITVNGGSGNVYNINNTTNINNSTTINLTDIGGHWAETYIKDLVKKGVLSGDNKHHFNPNANVTRAEFATMVAKYFNLKSDATTQDFNDVPTTSWAYKYIEATEPYFDKYVDLNGGYDFKPAQGAAREDVTMTMVKILMQLHPNMQLLDADSANQLLQKRFTDANKIAVALRPYVATAVQYGLINGDGKGHFLPEKVLSRAEAATLLDRLQDNMLVVDGTTPPTTDGGSTTTTDGGTGTTTTTDGGTTTTDSGSGTTPTTDGSGSTTTDGSN